LLAISRCFSGLIEAKPRFDADLLVVICASLGVRSHRNFNRLHG
jgi:hypothetical protein